MAERTKLPVEHLVRLIGKEMENLIDYEEQNWPAAEFGRGRFSASMGLGVMTSGGKAIRAPHGRIPGVGTETSTKWMG